MPTALCWCRAPCCCTPSWHGQTVCWCSAACWQQARVGVQRLLFTARGAAGVVVWAESSICTIVYMGHISSPGSRPGALQRKLVCACVVGQRSLSSVVQLPHGDNASRLPGTCVQVQLPGLPACGVRQALLDARAWQQRSRPILFWVLVFLVPSQARPMLPDPTVLCSVDEGGLCLTVVTALGVDVPHLDLLRACMEWCEVVFPASTRSCSK